MKILVMQLARFGDILQTLPAINALKRKYPEGEIHFLVRKRFKIAAELSECVDTLRVLDTTHILSPIYTEDDGSVESLDRMELFVQEMASEKFDLIYNLSYSPFSSYLASSISKENNSGNTIAIGNNNLSSGIYLVKIITKDQTTTKKVIVEKSN